MPQITLITGAAWPTSGTPTPANTGFDTMGAGATFVGSANVPPGSLAPSFIEFPAFSSVSFRFQPATEGYQSGEEWHWVKYWIYFEKTGTLTDNQATSFCDVNNGSTRLRVTLTSNVGNPDGILVASTSFIGGTSIVLGNKGLTHIPVNKWCEIVIGRRWHASDGRQVVLINGVKVAESYGMDTTSIGLTDFRSDWVMSNTASGWSGMKMRISGPCETWSGLDIPVRPRLDLLPANSYVKSNMIIHRDDNNNNKGRFWDYTGTSTKTDTNYATGGVNPSARRMIASGASASDFGMTSVDDVGLLPFNAEGYFSFVLTSFYLPGGGTMDLALRNSANNADVLKLSVDASRALKQGLTTLMTLPASARCALGITLKNTGEAYWFVCDQTNLHASGQVLFSGQLANWTNQSIGKIKIDAVLGSASIEIGSVMLCKYVETLLMDSLVSAGATAVSPVMASNDNHTGNILSGIQDEHAIPNASYYQSTWEALGLGWRACPFVLGRSGDSQASFYNNSVVPGGMNHIHGHIWWFMDGFGSVNDIFNPVFDNSTRDSVTASMKTMMNAIIDKLISQDNKMIVTTMIDRTLKTGLTTLTDVDLQAIHIHNNHIREQVVNKQNAFEYITFSDAAAYIGYHNDLFTTGDNIHFNSAGDGTYISAVLGNQVIPQYTQVLGPVTSLVASPGTSQVSLSWIAPVIIPDPITDYFIEYRIVGNPTFTTFAHSPSTTPNIIITGLANGALYEFRVAPVNVRGNGTLSSIFATPNGTLVEILLAKQNFTVEKLESTALIWNPVTDTAQTAYTLSVADLYFVVYDGDTKLFEKTHSSFIITGGSLNIPNLPLSPTDLANSGAFEYELWSLAANDKIAKGILTVSASKKNT